jgi:hypothetical protein
MTAELCLLAVKKLREQGNSEEIIRQLIQKGLTATMTADFNMKDEEGKVCGVFTAYAIHEPVMEELAKLAEGLGISWENTHKQTILERSGRGVTENIIRSSHIFKSINLHVFLFTCLLNISCNKSKESCFVAVPTHSPAAYFYRMADHILSMVICSSLWLA